MISEFIFLEADATKDEKSRNVALKVEIRELLKNDFNRKTVAEILLDLRKDVAGSAQKQLFELYKDLGLDKASYKKLRSWRWETISQGIRELTKMQVAESYSFITRFINDKRGTIRKQAEMAVVTLKPEGLNYFLDTTKHRISEWQQLKLMEVLANKENYVPPSFKVWLTSKNKYVVLFALRLIKHYDQNDANATIIELVKHKNNRIKREAIDCINSFHITDALETLKTVFWKCTPDIKIAILDAIGNIGKEADIDFLQLIENKEYSFSVRSKALAAINIISPETIMPTEGILDTQGYEVPQDISLKKLEVMEPENSLDEYVEKSPIRPTDENGDVSSQPEETAPVDAIVQKEMPLMTSDSDNPAVRKMEEKVIPDPNANDQVAENEPSEECEPTVPEVPQEDDKAAASLADLLDTIVVDATLTIGSEEPNPNKIAQDKPEMPSDMEDLQPLDENTEAPINDPEESNEFTTDFIPLVVDALNTEEEVAMSEPKNDIGAIAEMPVFYEVIDVPSKGNNAEASEVLRFDITKEDMYFIPLVTEDISIPIQPHQGDDEKKRTVLEGIEVISEEVKGEEKEMTAHQINIAELEVLFEEVRREAPDGPIAGIPLHEIPVVYETIVNNKKAETIKNLPMKAIDPLELTVIYQVVHASSFNGYGSVEELLEAHIPPSELSPKLHSQGTKKPVFKSLEEVLEAQCTPELSKNMKEGQTSMATEPPATQEAATVEKTSQDGLNETEEIRIALESPMDEESIVEEVPTTEAGFVPNTAEEKGVKEEEGTAEDTGLKKESTRSKEEEPQEPILSEETIANTEVQERLETTEEEIEEIGTIELELTGMPESVEMEDEIAEQELPDWLLEEIAEPNVRSVNKDEIKTEGPEWEAKVPKMMDDIQYYLRYIPEPVLYDSEISETMQLLDDIEFFGDERELPLLEELMSTEKKEVTHERLQDIIARFRGNIPPTDDGIFKLTPPYSIFQEFFRHCDTESKLILLAEVTAVGDEKEVYFLERLLDDPEPRIRAKASETLAMLKERLAIANPSAEMGAAAKIYSESEKMSNSEYQQLLNEMQINPPVESDIFEIDFELSPEGETYADDVIRGVKESPDSGNSFLNIFRKFNTKSRSKRNG